MTKSQKRIESCVICGEAPVQARGLCAKHHSRFHRQLKNLAPDQRQEFEQALIDRGLLNPPKTPGRQVNHDSFREVADELFVAEPEAEFQEEDCPAKKKSPKTSAKARSRKTVKKKATRRKNKDLSD